MQDTATHQVIAEARKIVNSVPWRNFNSHHLPKYFGDYSIPQLPGSRYRLPSLSPTRNTESDSQESPKSSRVPPLTLPTRTKEESPKQPAKATTDAKSARGKPSALLRMDLADRNARQKKIKSHSQQLSCSAMRKLVSELAPSDRAMFWSAVAGGPLQVLVDWLSGDGKAATHKRIMDPYAVNGIVVLSDSAGLSKLSKARPLLEVLRLIHEPKAVVYRAGVELGGCAIPPWVADNTAMFYSSSLNSCSDVLRMVVEAQQIVNSTCMVRIGIGIQRGSFYSLGGKFFGHAFENAESFAEDHTEGGEIALLKDFVEALQSEGLGDLPFEISKREDDQAFESWRVDYPMPPHPEEGTNTDVDELDYPSGLGSELFSYLSTHTLASVDGQREAVEHLRVHSIFVFLKIKHVQRKLFLDSITQSILVCSLVNNTTAGLGSATSLVKCNGNIGIISAQSPASAIAASLALQTELVGRGFGVSIGVWEGEAYIFDVDSDGGKDCTGMPINMASKLAEDFGEDGIFVDAAIQLPSSVRVSPVVVVKGGVDIHANRVLAAPSAHGTVKDDSLVGSFEHHSDTTANVSFETGQ